MSSSSKLPPTIYKREFKHYELNNVQKEIVQKSRLEIGKGPGIYKTINSVVYNSPDKDSTMWATHTVKYNRRIDDSDFTSTTSTTSRTAFSGSDKPIVAPERTPLASYQKSTHFVLGAEPTVFVTTTKAQFVDPAFMNSPSRTNDKDPSSSPDSKRTNLTTHSKEFSAPVNANVSYGEHTQRGQWSRTKHFFLG